MKCQHCNEREANTHIKRNINGKKEEMYLCDKCAEELGVMKEFEFEPFGAFANDSLFGNLLTAGVSALNTLTGIDRCTYCGSTWSDIVNSGRVGCDHCYEKFESRLEPSLERLHGKTKHIGKTVSYTEEEEAETKPESEVEKLKAELKTAIQEQRFEDAAVLRDKINELTKEEK